MILNLDESNNSFKIGKAKQIKRNKPINKHGSLESQTYDDSKKKRHKLPLSEITGISHIPNRGISK